jgi:uncharacterized protein YecE (DUF72 family)
LPGTACQPEIPATGAVALQPFSFSAFHFQLLVSLNSMKRSSARILIGTAGWSLPRAEQPHFPSVGSHLERYASRFAVVEINSSFHRSHKPNIWARWRDAVPPGFRFSVKMPKAITHTARLNVSGDVIAAFLEEVSVLETKLGCLLVQLPPSLAYDATVAEKFFETLKERTAVPTACEPRHPSWFDPAADELLRNLRVARVAADPARVPAATEPAGNRDFSYFRLHGSPKVYYSAYSDEFIKRLGDRLKHEAKEERTVWCVFDNTTLGAATRNALDLKAALERPAL